MAKETRSSFDYPAVTRGGDWHIVDGQPIDRTQQQAPDEPKDSAPAPTKRKAKEQ